MFSVCKATDGSNGAAVEYQEMEQCKLVRFLEEGKLKALVREQCHRMF